MDRREINWDGMHWIDLAQDRDRWTFVGTVMNLRVLCDVMNFLSNCTVTVHREGLSSIQLVIDTFFHGKAGAAISIEA
jgi:hypothetical protein